jgi:hypothetical protein
MQKKSGSVGWPTDPDLLQNDKKEAMYDTLSGFA